MKKNTYILFLFSVLFLSSSTSNPNGPTITESAEVVSNTVHGLSTTSFKVDETGNANYTIPVTMSPGINNVQPSIAMAYNSSSAGSSMLGVGWGLQGIPSISRAPNTIAQDCLNPNDINCRGRGVSLDGNDEISLNGQRLILISGSMFGNGSQYRTEQESWQKITFYTSSGNYFKILTPDGVTMYFGQGGAKTKAAGTSSTLNWWLNKVVDQYGNYYNITYHVANDRSEVVPNEIHYTGSSGVSPFAKIRFVYDTHAKAKRPLLKAHWCNNGGDYAKFNLIMVAALYASIN